MARRKKYSPEDLVNVLKTITGDIGSNPTYYNVENNPACPSVYMFKKAFGSWNNALKAAGLPLNHERKQYSKESLIEEIFRFQKENNRIPTEKLPINYKA